MPFRFLYKFLEKKMLAVFDENNRFINLELSKYCRNRQVSFQHAGKFEQLNILDVGCSDGTLTFKFLDGLTNVCIYGVDLLDECDDSRIIYSKVDLELEDFPYEDGYFDIVFSNQVIEHLLNKDHFLSEIKRVVKENGLYIISTENICSFDNILSMVLGQDPITQHTGSRYRTNSFISPHFMARIDEPTGNKYGHKNVCSYFGLKRLAEVNGLNEFNMKSFGNISSIFERLMPIYNRLILIYGIKKGDVS